MIYNDFPILNDEAYDFLKDKFDSAMPENRNVVVSKLFAGVLSCLSHIMGAKGDENREIKLALKKIEIELNKIEQNLSDNFNIYAEKKLVKTLNIFSLLKELNLCCKLSLAWLENEKKEYLKALAQSALNSLLDCQQEIITALNKCTIKIFRFF